MTSLLYAQHTDFKEVLEAYNKEDISYIYQELQKIDTTTLGEYDKATWLYYYADYEFLADQHDKAYKAILQSKEKFLKQDQQKDVKDCNIILLDILSHQNKLKIEKDSIIKELQNYADTHKDTTAIISLYNEIATKFLDKGDAEQAIAYFKKIVNIYQLQQNDLKAAHNNINVGTVYNLLLHNADSALYYTKKAVPVLIKHKDYRNLAYNYNNQAQQYRNQKKYGKAIEYLLKADSISLNGFKSKSKLVFYQNLAEVYQLQKDFKKSTQYYQKLLTLKDSLDNVSQNVSITEIKEKYDNEKLRADNLEIKVRNTQNRNIALGLGGSLVLGSIIVYLLYKNNKRKQKLILQQKEIKEKKLTAKLKEQELASINAMIEGQEKERIRIANDLHDDLGGLMATIKVFFSSFKDQDQKNLFQKTNDLLEEAYQKIRNIAHVENSGVFANQGLLAAVKQLADDISIAEKIKINVYEHELNQRLKNSLEITIFRIIQELITNVLKHANATEIDIHLNRHDKILNIMVEDNGIGFDTNQFHKNSNGMGLSSIDKRVDNLDGKVLIESHPNTGTTIIIDIPI